MNIIQSSNIVVKFLKLIQVWLWYILEKISRVLFRVLHRHMQENHRFIGADSNFLFSDNIKALFRRAKAHTGAWNPTEAKQDFQSVLDKDPSLSMTCKKEIRKVEEMEKQKNIEDKQKMKNLF